MPIRCCVGARLGRLSRRGFASIDMQPATLNEYSCCLVVQGIALWQPPGSYMVFHAKGIIIVYPVGRALQPSDIEMKPCHVLPIIGDFLHLQMRRHDGVLSCSGTLSLDAAGPQSGLQPTEPPKFISHLAAKYPYSSFLLAICAYLTYRPDPHVIIPVCGRCIEWVSHFPLTGRAA